MNRLAGKTALITGGARGQGRAIAVKFASEGANVVVCDIAAPIATLRYELATGEDLAETKALVEAEGADCLAEVADVRDQAALDAVVAKAIDAFGAVDILIAQAGIVSHAPLWEITEEQWRDVVDVTLNGAWRSVKAVAPHMIERGGGCVVLTSSLNGIEGGANYAHYIAAKHGVCGLMKCAAIELGPYNIRVNAVLPGPVDTPVIDNPDGHARIGGRPGAGRDEYLASVRRWYLLRGRTVLPARAVADAMTWLVSDEAKHVTGIELPIDAGHNVLPGLNMAPVEDWDAFDEPAVEGRPVHTID
jgi:SDR family mycofactocin-dependent oxidoreductase